jgi:Uma2 family endonuclease
MAVMAPYEDIPVRYGGFTVEDLDAMPDDGRRYELIDGVLLVSPSPRWEHQHASIKIGRILDVACPDDFAVLAPVDVRGGPRTSVQPDLSVARGADVMPGESYLSIPLLAVEILSPSSVGVDRLLKRHVYAAIGVPSYWIVDLDEPAVTVLTLVNGSYVEQTTVAGDDPLTVTDPFPVTFRPSQLVRS